MHGKEEDKRDKEEPAWTTITIHFYMFLTNYTIQSQGPTHHPFINVFTLPAMNKNCQLSLML